MPDATDRRARRAILLIGIVIVAILALSLTLLPLGGSDEPDMVTVGGHPLHGQPAPEIDLLTLEGERLRLSELRGRPVLLNFWASWCGPCREEFPMMVETYATYATQDLEILGVIHDDTPAAAEAFADEQGATWPMLLDPDDEAWDAYRGVGLPTSFFIDADGIVQAFSLGPFSEEGLALQLATIMPEA